MVMWPLINDCRVRQLRDALKHSLKCEKRLHRPQKQFVSKQFVTMRLISSVFHTNRFPARFKQIPSSIQADPFSDSTQFLRRFEWIPSPQQYLLRLCRLPVGRIIGGLSARCDRKCLWPCWLFLGSRLLKVLKAHSLPLSCSSVEAMIGIMDGSFRAGHMNDKSLLTGRKMEVQSGELAVSI
jgi:hypothetical protein